MIDIFGHFIPLYNTHDTKFATEPENYKDNLSSYKQLKDKDIK